ncbi:PhzF family phenazine biosynthesis isomerase [Variovorax rhizosphaerae]|uniref:PhzF family phenazine biosynthesis isomerase n=1 Tax=Variovorax rhizosphaerae TaxID=1836200 RepID=A0ABU8WIG4_9BURK
MTTMQMIRVFGMKDREDGGNPAPVWLDADAMSADDMLAQARRSGHESVFVLKPADAAHALRLRYFVPRHEMEMCGHATVAALWLLHERGEWDGSATTIETLSGTVRGRFVDGMVEISQPSAVMHRVDDVLVAEIAACLRIAVGDIRGPVVNSCTSRVKTLIPLDAATLAGLQVDLPRVESLCEKLGSTGLYPYALVAGETATASARQFPKSSGYPEDPATGIAAAALAWGLRQRGAVGDAGVLVTVRQGEAMGSPSEIFVRLPAADAASQDCWLRGDARPMLADADRRLDAVAPRDEVTRARPSGHYASLSRAGDMLYTSGVVGRENGRIITGRLEGPGDVSNGQRAAMAAVRSLLHAVQHELGSLGQVRRVVALNGYLAASAGFTDHVQVMDAASKLLREVFPDSALPVRTTVGVSSLPGGGMVEVSMVLELQAP